MTTTTTEITGQICMMDTSLRNFFAFAMYEEMTEGTEIVDRNYIVIIAEPRMKEKIFEHFVAGMRITAICQELEIAIPFNEMDWKSGYELISVQDANSEAE